MDQVSKRICSASRGHSLNEAAPDVCRASTGGQHGRWQLRPTAEETAWRLVVLKHLVSTALATPPGEMLQPLLRHLDAAKRAEFTRAADERRDKQCRWLQESGLWPHASPREREFFQSTFVTMTARQQVDASWRMEAVQVLMWALGILPQLPPYDAMADHELLQEVPSDDPAKFAQAARLRNQGELDQARDLAELWHWRSRTRTLIEKGEVLKPDAKMQAAGLHTFDDIVRLSARRAAEAGLIGACADGDFQARGKPYRELSGDEWSEVRSITMERHFALNWLCGYAPGNRWDETPTDT